MRGSHGGAWKVAYADFVTAMMALFIVLWMTDSTERVKASVTGTSAIREATRRSRAPGPLLPAREWPWTIATFRTSKSIWQRR